MRFLGLVRGELDAADRQVPAEVYLLYAREEGASLWEHLEPRLEENPELRRVLWRAPTQGPGALIDLELGEEAPPSGPGREVGRAVPVVEVIDLRGPHGPTGAQRALQAGLSLRVAPAERTLLWLNHELVVGPLSLRLQDGRWFLPEGTVLEARLSLLEEVGNIVEVSVEGMPRRLLVPRAAPPQPGPHLAPARGVLLRSERRGRSKLSPSLVALQARLDEGYSALAESSAERRVFVLEHRLDDEQRRELFTEVSAALSQEAPDSPAWLHCPLPLLVAASEVGYAYRGSGTDFWPLLGERLGCVFCDEERAALTRLFGAFVRRYRGARPADTDWNRLFCHIAWPIHHAVLPLEFHRPLMTALAGLTVRVRPTTRSDEVVRELQRWAASHGSKRFQNWLCDTELAADIAREMLGLAPEEGRWLEPALLARLHQDLEKDEAARGELEVALARQEELDTPAPSATTPRRLSLRLLRTQEGGPRLLLAMPGLTGSCAEEVRLALRRLRFMPRPWGLGSPLHSDSLFTPGLVPLRLERLPAPGVPLLPGLEALPIEGAQELLGPLTVDLAPPLVFRVSPEGEQASQRQGRGLRLGQRYWLLVEEAEAEALHAAGATEVGPVAGLVCLEVEAQGAMLRWLEEHGFTLSKRPKVAWEGAPSLSLYAERPTFAEGDCVALRLARVPEGGAWVEVRGPKGSEELQLEAEGFVLVEGSGEVRATVVAGDERQERSARLGAPPPPPVSLLRLGLEPTGSTLQDLLRRRCVLRVDSLVALEVRSLTVSLSWGGRVRTWAELRPLEVPAALGFDSPLWDQLLPQHLLERVARQERLTLQVSVGALASEEWSLEQEVAHLWWEEREGELPQAFTEAGSVALQVVPASAPLAEPVPLQGQAPLPEGVGLLFPLPVEGRPVFAGRCIGPAQPRLVGDGLPRRPERLLRQVEGLGREWVGARQVVEAYLHWSLAVAPTLPLELRRRETAACIERWSVEQLCGEDWGREEPTALEHAVGDPWEAVVAVRDEGRPRHGEVTLGSADKAWFGAWLRRSLRETLGELPGEEELSPALVARLNQLFTEGLRALLAQAEAAVRPVSFTDEHLEVREGEEVWRECFTEARRRVELPSLLRALRSPAGEAEHLLHLDYVSTGLEALAEELTGWVRHTQGLLGTPCWGQEEVHALLALWTVPQDAVRLEWRRALARGLEDQAMARAVRYVALRARLAQHALGTSRQREGLA